MGNVAGLGRRNESHRYRASLIVQTTGYGYSSQASFRGRKERLIRIRSLAQGASAREGLVAYSLGPSAAGGR
jgi:hypothetical protein